ncbi:alpha/beta hydrolase [Verticiella sediminum]|uniref:Alpha/beta hydrolase n=1 Tax=Verticiella sediminum TaxID=1247510 RepID=A0A556A5W4_9BURK|nr:alpha/beta hydrolase-fold protein [Verticiella sediminum]TSH88268.1 alpha/beta hydrolase [Verticiella sediminum]
MTGFSELALADRGPQGARRVHLRVPSGAPPAAGHPVLYILDGDAARDALAGTAADVVVAAIGYDLDPESLKAARAYDYTPAIPGRPALRDPRVPAWRAGGADALLDWIDAVVRPAVHAAAGVDRTRETLAGHSYGGLCVLHALCRAPQAYAGYLAASPSVWWYDGAILDEVTQLARAAGTRAAPARPARVLVMAGEHEARHARAVGADGTPHSRTGGVPTLGQAQALAARLQTIPGLCASFEAVPGGTHASLLDACARRALAFAAEGRYHCRH